VDLRLDCSLSLPSEVAREAEKAAGALARPMPFPSGSLSLQDYHRRFLEHYGIGMLVLVRQLTDPDIGLGFPAGYRGSLLPRPAPGLTTRDEQFLALAPRAACLPTLDGDAVRAQVCSPPLHVRTENVSRAPEIWPHVISLTERRFQLTLSFEDLAVGADAKRLYVVSVSTGRRVEPAAMNAVDLANFTHPLGRLLCELPRGRAAALGLFSWGAARHLPFLPRIRYGRPAHGRTRYRRRARLLPARALRRPLLGRPRRRSSAVRTATAAVAELGHPRRPSHRRGIVIRTAAAILLLRNGWPRPRPATGRPRPRRPRPTAYG
jgi:hypothetical protein